MLINLPAFVAVKCVNSMNMVFLYESTVLICFCWNSFLQDNTGVSVVQSLVGATIFFVLSGFLIYPYNFFHQRFCAFFFFECLQIAGSCFALLRCFLRFCSPRGWIGS